MGGCRGDELNNPFCQQILERTDQIPIILILKSGLYLGIMLLPEEGQLGQM